MKRIYILLLSLFGVAWTAQAEVLWWATDSAADIDVAIMGTEDVVRADTLGVTHARIRDDSGDYLSFVYWDAASGSFMTNDRAITTGIPVDQLWTDIGTDAGKSFVVELGNYNTTTKSWTSIASSEPTSYNDLIPYIGAPQLDMPSHVVWKPSGFTAVPEPTGGLLTLLGAALLALKRKKRI